MHVIVCHPVGFAFDTFLQPATDVTAEHRVPAQVLASEGEVGQYRKHQIEVVMPGVNGVQVVEVAVHSVRPAHHAEVGAESEPVGETVTGLNAHIIAA